MKIAVVIRQLPGSRPVTGCGGYKRKELIVYASGEGGRSMISADGLLGDCVITPERNSRN